MAATSYPPLDGDRTCDVVVVGGGLTGLWTAYYLAESGAGLNVVVVEAEHVGWGASGRNGGWCSAKFPASPAAVTARTGSSRTAALALHAAMRDTVAEVERVLGAEDIACDWARGGSISLARSAAQCTRARARVTEALAWGRTDLALLTQAEAESVVRAAGTLGATYTPDCAALHPGRLVAGLAQACVRRGVTVAERTRATSVEPGRVVTDRGVVRTRHVVRATEGYGGSLAGQRRRLAPVYSLVVATEPLPAAVWEEIGLRRRETFTDHRHLIVYGQRTADDRIVFGGRGAPYHLGSRTRAGFDLDTRVFAGLRATLVEMFPVLEPVRFTHAWGGALGIPRDWCASVGLEEATGMGWAGGYVGQGVGTANLAGRTLRDLVLGRRTGLTRLPWVGHRSPRWEPEPLRWLGINAGLRAAALADLEERVSGRPSVVARALALPVG